MTTIVRFECGCIGTRPGTNGLSAILIACDGENGSPGNRERNMDNKAFDPIKGFNGELWIVFDQAYKYRQLRATLRSVVNDG